MGSLNRKFKCLKVVRQGEKDKRDRSTLCYRNIEKCQLDPPLLNTKTMLREEYSPLVKILNNSVYPLTN